MSVLTPLFEISEKLLGNLKLKFHRGYLLAVFRSGSLGVLPQVGLQRLDIGCYLSNRCLRRQAQEIRCRLYCHCWPVRDIFYYGVVFCYYVKLVALHLCASELAVCLLPEISEFRLVFKWFAQTKTMFDAWPGLRLGCRSISCNDSIDITLC